LFLGVTELVGRYKPDGAAIEETFVNRNPSSTLKLGQARGAVIAAAGSAGVPVAEYAPNRIKKTVVGAGHAGKEQVETMVRRLLPGCLAQTADAADALAVAICHAHSNGGLARAIALAEAAR